MRYAQGGGLRPAQQAARERVRLEAAARFERGEKTAEIAARLRVGERSVERWRSTWNTEGAEGLRSRGSPGRPKLDDQRFAQLESLLRQGPQAHGWDDQRWTLARITALIGRRFHIGYTPQGVWALLKRHGWSWQQPARRATERDDAAIEVWKAEVWPQVKARWRPARRGWSSKTSPAAR